MLNAKHKKTCKQALYKKHACLQTKNIRCTKNTLVCSLKTYVVQKTRLFAA